jgi:hypothetical protein
MKTITLILFSLFVTSVFAQGIGTGGGSGPSKDSSFGRCEVSDSQVSLLEEEFVKLYDRNYVNHQDFVRLLERILVDSTFDILDRMHQYNHVKDSTKCAHTDSTQERLIVSKRAAKKTEVELLKKILAIYKEEAKAQPRCLKFKIRLRSIETLEYVIKFYE